MYEELIAKLRNRNACISIKTLDDAADAIEKLEAYCDLYKECGEKLMEAMRRIKEDNT